MSKVGRKVFLTGATGDVGTQVLKTLEVEDLPVRIICRRQKQADDLRQRGLDVVVGNLNDPVETLSKHLSGCDTLLLLTAATPDQRQQCFNAIDAAALAGITWIVKVSAADARDEGNVPWVKDHAAADEYLKAQAQKHGISWTILSASAFMQNLLAEASAIRVGFLPQACGNGRAGWVDTADVAAVAAHVLKDTGAKHHGKNYIITGPQLISLPEVADAFSRQVGHRVRYIDLPGPVFGLLLRLGGADSWMANGLVAQFTEIVRPNKEGIEVSNVVQELVGRPPRSFEQFAAEHKDAFWGIDVVPFLGAFIAVLFAVIEGMRMKKIA